MDFNEHTQRTLLSYMISDPASFAISQTIIDPDHFEDRLRPAVRYILDYADKFKVLPTPDQIEAQTRVEIKRFGDDAAQHTEWYLQTIERFARRKALELTVLDGVDLIEKDNGDELERRVKAAMTISLMRDLGTDYFHDPAGRLQRMKDKSNYVSTGWKVFDDKLYGGFTRGALNVFAGGSGSGKSLFLQNLALNWVEMGLNVIYFTLELSEELVSLRLDAMVTGLGTKSIFKNLDEVAMKVRFAGQKWGSLIVKKMPEAGTNANDLRAFLKEYEIKTGRKPDAVIVDYLDLMYPNNERIDPSNLFSKDKATSEEMRGLAGEYDLLCATASQLNRQSVEAAEFDHSHIAGGISKINTADNVFGIFTSIPMRERGIYQLQFLKTRSAAAVGHKIELRFNPESMRISDPDGSEQMEEEQQRPTPVDELRARLKGKTATVRQPSADDGESEPPKATMKIRTDIKDLMARTRRGEV